MRHDDAPVQETPAEDNLPGTPAESAEAVPSGAEVPAPAAGISFRDRLQVMAELLRKWSWTLILLLSILVVGYYTLFPSRGYFHSDTTDSLMWAVASSETGSLFNADFEYACLLPFSTSLIMWALIPVFGVSMTTHVLSMLCFFLLFTGAMIWMLRKMDWSWSWVSTAVFIVLMICSGSEKLREIFWGHTIYYSLGVLFIFVGLALLFWQMDIHKKRDTVSVKEAQKKMTTRLIVCTVLIGVWFLLACTNQIIAIAIFALPVMAAVFCERWLDENVLPFCKKNRRALGVFLVMGAGMVLGYLITAVLAKDISAGYESAFSNYTNMDNWVDNALGFPRAWLVLLGVEIRDGDPLMSVKSVGELLKVITGVILLIVPVVALFCYKKIDDEKLRILTLTFWFMTMLIMMGYILGRLSSANWRLSPIVAMSAVVTMAFIRWSVGQISLRRIMTLLMIPVMMVSMITAVKIIDMPADNTEDSNLYAFAEELEARGLSYGYATFWHANGLTVVADSRVKCRAVTIDDGGCRPYYYQGCRSWYDNQPGQPQYFLLLTQGEADKLIEIGSPLAEFKVMEFSINGFPVWVYNENIF